LTLTTLCVHDQRDIGVAAGVAGSARSLISTVATTIYSVVLTARLQHTIPSEVPPALISAGLPAASVSDFITALSTGNTAALEKIEGFTPIILEAGQMAYKWANSQAYQTVFLTSIAISGLATLSALFIPRNLDHLMTMEVTSTLHTRKSTKTVGMA